MAEVSYILLVIPLIFPHQQHYAFLFSVPAFAYVLFMVVSNYYEMTKAKRMILLSALSVIYLCGNLRSVLGEFNYYYEHFKILTYGALLLIPCLMWAAAVQRNISGVAQKGNVPEA
jgi:glucose-6-phosphate-specific signal transduction histidine kinase